MQAPAPVLERLRFSGTGSEYFRIWIVNLLLSMLTLGIYSAWAKVRRQRYLYDNTRLAGSSFEYHGNPVSILKGRLIALAALGCYQLVIHLKSIYAPLALLALGAALPWLIWRSLQFKLHNSSYRGIRFGFRGSVGTAYLVFLLLPLLSVCTLYLLTPFTHQRIKHLQHTQARFGATRFGFDASVGSFYKIYLLGLLVGGIGFFAILMLSLKFGGLDGHGLHTPPLPFLIVLLYGWLFLLLPLFLTLLQNLVWNHTRIGSHQFSSNMRWGRASFIVLSNIIGIVCTLGRFIPFAHIRLLRYRIESISVTSAGSVDTFIAANDPAGSATGEGISDFLDFDLSL